MKTQVMDRLNRIIGFIDEDTYYTIRDNEKGQIFQHPKYLSAVGLSIDIIRQLLRANVRKLNYFIVNFEKESFNAIIDFKEFLIKSKEVQFGGVNSDPQRILSLKEFTRVYKGQQKLI